MKKQRLQKLAGINEGVNPQQERKHVIDLISSILSADYITEVLWDEIGDNNINPDEYFESYKAMYKAMDRAIMQAASAVEKAMKK